MLNPEKRLKPDDLQRIRKKLGLNGIDFNWVMGIGSGTLNQLKNKEYVGPTNRELLARILLEHPDLVPVPPQITFEELWSNLEKLNLDPKLTISQFAMLLGVSSWNGYAWAKGADLATTTQRLFYLFNRMIEERGIEGYQQFVEVVEKMAIAHGFKNGVTDVIRNKGWRSKKPVGKPPLQTEIKKVNKKTKK